MARRQQPALVEVIGADNVRRFGPALHTYDELLDLPDTSAILLGVPGHTKRDNLIRDRVAEAVEHEHVRRIETGASRQTSAVGESEVVFGVGFIREHRGDVRAAIEDERFHLLVEQCLGFGRQIRNTDPQAELPRFETIVVRPQTREDHGLIATRLDTFLAIAESLRDAHRSSRVQRGPEAGRLQQDSPSLG